MTLEERYEKCKKEKLCFISLKPLLGKKTVYVYCNDLNKNVKIIKEYIHGL
jgi:hypothetical protein